MLLDSNSYGLAEESINKIGTNYVGSKRKIMSWISKTLEKHNLLGDDKYFVDVFGGSGSFSFYLCCLGMRGFINDLMISSHLTHRAMFHGEYLSGDLTEIPKFVKFNEFIYKDLPSNKGIKINNAKSLLSISNYKSLNNKVSLDCDFCSTNEIFNSFWSMSKNYIGRYFTAKEAFSFCKILTNVIITSADINIEEDNSFDKSKVMCFQGDAEDFIINIENYLGNIIAKDNCFIYLDPPYGGWNSNYHQIYSVIECYAYAFLEIRKKYINLRNIDGEDNTIQKKDYYGVYTTIVGELPHILKYGNKLNTKNAAALADHRYDRHFENLMLKCCESSIINTVVSFNSDSSWGSEEEIFNKLNEYFNEVIIEKTKHNYAFRYRQQETVGLSEKIVGSDDLDFIEREGTSEEILFICKRR